jgi:DNA-binding Xre family transcriptional regulator
MAFSYNKLWKLLIDKKMMKKDLMALTDLTTTTMAKMGKERPVSMDVLARICKALKCNVGDIVDYIGDDAE